MYKLGRIIGTSILMFIVGIISGFTLSAISFWYFRNSIEDKTSALFGLGCGSVCHFYFTIFFAKMIWLAL